MPASPKRQATKSVQGLLSAPPQARPQTGGPAMSAPQTGGPSYGQGMSPRQEQRAQYLATHPNARGNQPQTQGQALGQAMSQNGMQRPQQQQKPIPQQMGQPMGQQLADGGQMPQGGFQPMPRPIQGGGGFGAPMQDMMYRYPQGQQPDFSQIGQGMQNGLGQQGQQNPGQWQDPRMNTMNWYKGNGGY